MAKSRRPSTQMSGVGYLGTLLKEKDEEKRDRDGDSKDDNCENGGDSGSNRDSKDEDDNANNMNSQDILRMLSKAITKGLKMENDSAKAKV
jgi:hypothetical protein